MAFQRTDYGVGPQKAIFDLENEIQALQIENTDLYHDNRQLLSDKENLQNELAEVREQAKAMQREYEAVLAQHHGFSNRWP